MLAKKSQRYRILVMDGRIQSCLPVIKALRLAGHHVTIAESDPLCVGFLSRYPHRRIRHRDPRKNPEGFLSDLRRYLSTGEYDVLIPILDVTAELVSQHKPELARLVRIPLVDYPIFMRARDKSQTMKIAQSHGLPIPKTYFPDEMTIAEIAALVDYPVLIKPNISVGARGLTKVKDAQELKKLYPLVVARYGASTVQEFIPQTGLQYKAQFFLDRSQEVKAWVVYSKIRHFPLEGGVSTLNCTVAREDIASLGKKLLHAMDWYSYADIDLITDPRDGQVKIMEVNPRITGSVKICFEAGVDFAKMLVALAMDDTVEPVQGYQAGLYLRHPGLDLIWFWKSPHRFKADPSWFRFLGKNLRYDVWSLEDPAPFLAYVLANVRDLFSAEARRYKYQRAYLP
jgi:D-aspartate ligase